MNDAAAHQSKVLEQLDRMLSSPTFQSAERSRRLLRYLVEETLAGKGGELKEYTIGSEVLGRGAAFDPRIDSIVRVEISRLRSRLEQYQATHGKHDELRVVLPRGSYKPVIDLQTAGPAEASANAATGSRVSFGWFAAGCLVGAVLVLAVVWLWNRNTPVDPLSTSSPITLQAQLGASVRLANVVGSQFAISPNGTVLALVTAGISGGSQLQLRRLDVTATVPVPGSEGARNPFFSPDGQWVAFWANGKLRKVAVSGGAPMALADAPDLLGGSWGDDGNIVASLTTEAKLWRVPSSGGRPEPALDLSPQMLRLLWPQILPGSKWCVFSNATLGPDSGSVEAVELRSGARKTLVRNGTYGRVLPSGHLIYVNQGTLYAQGFDTVSMEVRGAPVAMMQDIAYSPTFGFAQVDVSGNGTLVYRRGAGQDRLTLQRLNRGGGTKPIIPSPGSFLWPRISPDGRFIAFTRLESGESRVWIVDQNQNAPTPATQFPGYHATPLWSPDGRFLIFQGRGTVEWLPYPGTTAPRTLLQAAGTIPWSFSPDGARLAFYQMNPQTHFDLWTVPITYDNGELKAGSPEPYLRTSAVETYPTFSPDGRWIAYVSLQSGGYEVYVRSYPDTGDAIKVSRGGGRLPFWAKNSPELIYETEDHRLMAARWRVRNGRFEVDAPEAWSQASLGDTGVLANFDVAPDDTVVALLPVPNADESLNSLSFRVQFFDDLNTRLPGRGGRRGD